MRSTSPRHTVAVVSLVLLSFLGTADAAPPQRQPQGIKSKKIELYKEAACEHENGQVITKEEAAAIRAIEESGRAVLVRCGDKQGWVDRQDLEYELPPSEKCRDGKGGSGRGSNACR